MTAGFNPMRWDCGRSGCFNMERRPKIEEFADCFPRRINFGDIDGLVELNGKFCLLEWKGDGGMVREGQRRTYVEWTRVFGNIVFVVEGDAKTMAVRRYGIFWNGKQKPWTVADMSDLKIRIRDWAQWTNSARRSIAA